ncbi:UNVERIFIED_CONTAM: GATA transcription factor 5 [Sesamum radiatum]|uniref:GATA transcription factor 5 n=1 Tax=Sesamum radiatum TaxID=300843 RepID=A0AAW2RUS8_SESRA
MECIEARALKSSFLSQMAMKTTSQVFYNDDVWCLTGINNVASDDFPVEDLLNLDFSEKEFQEGFFSQEDDVSQKASSYNSSSIFSGTDDFDSLSAGELAVPDSLVVPRRELHGEYWGEFGERAEPVNWPPQNIRAPCFPMRVPSKARSKRSRPNGRPWSLTSPPLSSTDSSSTSSSSYGSSSVSPFIFTNPVLDTEWFSSAEKPPAKKQKRKPDAESGSVSGRRCTHCQVQKTPQWRTGPLGPKTLCNACGVRFKSGRLFPEYRPACSPTFSQEMHSNSHRKVLEMRRKKEVGEETEPGLTRVVQSMSL